MLRLLIIMIVGGVLLGFYGYQEYSVSTGTTEVALEIELSEIEENSSIENNHLKIGGHWALMEGAIYEYQLDDGESEADLNSNTSITVVYYPIISNSHPYMQSIWDLAAIYEDLDEAPDEEWPDLNEFTVLIKTKKYKTLGSIPEETFDQESVSGLVINRISPLGSEEKRLLQETFPAMDLSSALILEENRKPNPKTLSILLMGLGGALILGGIALLIKMIAGSKVNKKPKVKTDPFDQAS